MKKALLALLLLPGFACMGLPVPSYSGYPAGPDVTSTVTPDGTIEVLEAQCGADFAPCPEDAPVCCARQDGLVWCSAETDCSWEQDDVQPWACLSDNDCGGDRPFCCMSVGSSCQPSCDIETFPQVCQDDADCKNPLVPECVKPYMKATPPGVGRCGS
jgi:hypothetical protein